MRWVVIAVLAQGCGRVGFYAASAGADAGGDGADGPPSTCVADLAVGEAHSCALLVDGSLWCWGLNEFGQLGTGSTSPPVPMPARATAVTGVKGVEGGRSLTCVLRTDDQAACFGQNNDQQVDGMTTADPTLTPSVVTTPALSELHLGFNYVCGQAGNQIVCWGDGDEGEPGHGTDPDTHAPESVTGIGWHDLAAGATHLCAFDAAGNLACWGDARDKRLSRAGDATCAMATDGSIPCDLVPTGTGLQGVGVAAGEGHTCMWIATGEVSCFGKNAVAQSGQPPSLSITPTVVAGLPPVKQVVAGQTHTCALDRNGGVWCWGANNVGQLGSAGDMSATPVQLDLSMFGGTAVALVTHSLANHTCAIMADGTAVCWGANGTGQLGRGTLGASGTPARVSLPCP